MGQKVWETFTNQKQWESYLKNLIKINDSALIKAIVLIYDLQTAEEKNTGKSVEDNKIGFSKIDAYELGNIAKKIKRGQSLTEAEVAKSRNKMQKYWKQLMVISKKQMQEKKDQEELKQVEEEMHYEQLTFEDALSTQEKTCPCSYGICGECESKTERR